MSIGIALSGGGVRGGAHIGVLRALHEEYIKPDIIAGTSAGALVAGFYAAGYTPDELVDIATRITWRQFEPDTGHLLGEFFSAILRLPFGKKPIISSKGIIEARKFERFLLRYFGNKKITDLDIPIAITAVDINRGESIVFTNTSISPSDYAIYNNVRIVDALRASIAIPVIFTPKLLLERQLVDGGVTNNLPLDLIYAMGAKQTISVNLGYTGQLDENIDNLFEIGSQSIDIMSYQITKLRNYAANLTIEPGIYDIKTLDFSRVTECIERGYLTAKNALKDVNAFNH